MVRIIVKFMDIILTIFYVFKIYKARTVTYSHEELICLLKNKIFQSQHLFISILVYLNSQNISRYRDVCFFCSNYVLQDSQLKVAYANVVYANSMVRIFFPLKKYLKKKDKLYKELSY